MSMPVSPFGNRPASIEKVTPLRTTLVTPLGSAQAERGLHALANSNAR